MQKALITNGLTELQPDKPLRSGERGGEAPPENATNPRVECDPTQAEISKSCSKELGTHLVETVLKGSATASEKAARRAGRKEFFLSVLCTKLTLLFPFYRKFASIVWDLFGWLLGSPFPKGMAGKEIH